MMYDWVSANAERELHNPNSPYYIDGPSTWQTVQNYINGSIPNTNYFGANKSTYLAQPKADTVEILRNNQQQRQKETLWKTLAVVGASAYGLLALKKMHLLPQFSGKIFKVLGQGVKSLLKVITWPLR